MIKTALAVLPVASTSFVEEARLVDDGSGRTLTFGYEIDGDLVRGRLRFDAVRAVRWRAESHCTAWHIAGAYDTLCVVEDSDWVDELLAAEPEHDKGGWVVRHFIVYLDSSGCYEIAAASWSMIPTS